MTTANPPRQPGRRWPGWEADSSLKESAQSLDFSSTSTGCGPTPEARSNSPVPTHPRRRSSTPLSEPAKGAQKTGRRVRRVRNIVAQRAFHRVRGAEISPWMSAASEAQIAETVAATATTGHHPIGTCKMGINADPMAVVDGASVFPSQITGNLNAVISAIAEKAADLLLGRSAPPPEDLA